MNSREYVLYIRSLGVTKNRIGLSVGSYADRSDPDENKLIIAFTSGKRFDAPLVTMSERRECLSIIEGKRCESVIGL